MNTEEALNIVNHASQQSDRWLFLALLVVVLIGGIIIIKYLVNQNEKQREAHATLTEKMAVALHNATDIMGRLHEWLKTKAPLVLWWVLVMVG